MARTEDVIGINDAGRRFLTDFYESCGTKTAKRYIITHWDDKEDAEFVELSIEETKVIETVYEEFEGQYGGSYPLLRWTHEDDSSISIEEFVEATYHSSGPMHFYALRYTNGEVIKETLWNEEEMQRY